MLCMIVCLCGALWQCPVGELCVDVPKEVVDQEEVGAWEEDLWRLDLKKGSIFEASIVWDLLAFNHDHVTYLVYKQQTLKNDS